MGEAATEMLVLRAEDRRFAVPTALVREVARAVWVEPLPGAPPAVEGIIDYRGTPTPVFDVRARFGLPIRPLHPRDHLVVLGIEGRTLALRVDRAESLVQAPTAALDASMAAGSPASGVVSLDGELLLVHDPERFLTSDELVAIDAALEARPEHE